MKVAVIYNKKKDVEGVINVFGMQNKETYNPKTVERVASALEQGGHNVRIIDGNINVIEQLQAFMPREIQGERPGMVFNMAYGIQGVSRYTHIPSLLEMLGIPYVGSSPAGHGIALDKVTTKVMVAAAGLPTAPYWVFYSADQIPDDLPYPVITKPKMEAVSLGIVIVHNKEDLKEQIARLVEEFRQPVLVEQFIPGREFAVGLLGNGDPEVLPIVEIDLEGDRFAIQSLEDKLKQPRGKICPAQIPVDLAQELSRLTKETFRTLGIYDFCRVDYRMDENGKLYILELNSMASLGLTGAYFTAAKVAGYTYESMINRMLDVAVERYFGKQQMEHIGEMEPLVKNLLQTTTPLRSRLRNYLRGNQGTMEESLRKMVEINSYVRHIDGVNSLGQWLSAHLANLGFQREVFTRAEFGNVLYFTNHSAEVNDVLLVGQLDNPVHFQDFQPFLIERGRYYGTGVSRGKGGLAVLLGALQALRYTRKLKKVKCGILLVTDESVGGRSSKSLVQELSGKSRRVLGLRGAGSSGELHTSFSGALGFNIEINRILTKPSQDAKEKYDLLNFVSSKIAALRKLSSPEDGLSVIITSVQTKGTDDLPPDYGAMSFYVRFRSAEQREQLSRQIQKIFEVSSTSPIRVHTSKSIQRQPFLPSEESHRLFEQIKKLADILEVRVQETHSDQSSLLCFVSPGVPVIDGLGPVTAGYGIRNEYVVRDSLMDRAVLLAYVLHQASKNFPL